MFSSIRFNLAYPKKHSYSTLDQLLCSTEMFYCEVLNQPQRNYLLQAETYTDVLKDVKKVSKTKQKRETRNIT